jgi:2-polyprenyl-3-methyl-5-hydroxy-6-metoxy-1,4-benzoquinol methylase
VSADRLPSARRVDRVEYLVEHCRGRSVLHLGCAGPACADHLHRSVGEVASELWGVDLSEAALEELRAGGGEVGRLIVGDVEHLGELCLARRFDVVLAGEVLEHLGNPGMCLDGAHDLLKPGGRLVVSAPSALSVRVFLNALLRRERVQADHRCWFSPRTLRRLLTAHGYAVEEMLPYWGRTRSGAAGLLDRGVRLLGLLSPWLGEGLVACARAAK